MYEGGSAFPTPEIRDGEGNGIRQGTDGMSMRDYFVGQLLSGFWSDRNIAFFSAEDRQKLAQSTFEVADAVLAERHK